MPTTRSSPAPKVLSEDSAVKEMNDLSPSISKNEEIDAAMSTPEKKLTQESEPKEDVGTEPEAMVTSPVAEPEAKEDDSSTVESEGKRSREENEAEIATETSDTMDDESSPAKKSKADADNEEEARNDDATPPREEGSEEAAASPEE